MFHLQLAPVLLQEGSTNIRLLTKGRRGSEYTNIDQTHPPPSFFDADVVDKEPRLVGQGR